jgi:predicted 3-demethylubiquinone-9 3-methyltransferase (glyoxalase superfamily)
MQKVTSMLWFDGQAQEAVRFYASVFKKAKVGKPMKGPDGGVLVVPFEVGGLKFSALNGGPQFKFNESISFVVNCETQQEIDELWEKLSAGGQKVQCGWLKDKYGVSWQVVPTVLGKLFQDKDGAKTKRVGEAMMQMKKLDIATLQRAYAGR